MQELFKCVVCPTIFVQCKDTNIYVSFSKKWQIHPKAKADWLSLPIFRKKTDKTFRRADYNLGGCSILMPPKYNILPDGEYIAYAKQESYLLACMDGDGFAYYGYKVLVKDGYAYFVSPDGTRIKECNNKYLQHNYKIGKT